ncbi:hypothetical protein [Bradyrhizobium murdochi]|uniref:hypothetical protein n=1 Tax=Bradyrhizobium murdochi TaxID=1038859 RepID=UPI0004037694|nr:hypothetical protein [Bradyrhizobium murdochi]
MNVESEIKDLKTRLEATEAVHALLIGALARIVVSPAGFTADELMRGVRESISTRTNGNDPALVERMQLLSEQYVEDAIYLVEHCMKSFDRPS